MSRQLFKLSGLILGIAVLAMPALATTVQKFELPELVSVSDTIVQGRVESVEARYENKMINTYASVVIDEVLKGGPRRAVLLKHPGGKIGSLSVNPPGMPQFKVGDQMILFLRDRKDGTFDVIGLGQGKYDITNGTAVANVSGVSILDPRSQAISDGDLVRKTPVDTFKARIRELVR